MNATIRQGASFVASAAILGAFTGGIGSAAVLGGTLFLTNKSVGVTALSNAIERKANDLPEKLSDIVEIINRIAIASFLTAAIAIATGLTAASLPATTLFLGATFVLSTILNTVFENCCKKKKTQTRTPMYNSDFPVNHKSQYRRSDISAYDTENKLLKPAVSTSRRPIRTDYRQGHTLQSETAYSSDDLI